MRSRKRHNKEEVVSDALERAVNSFATAIGLLLLGLCAQFLMPATISGPWGSPMINPLHSTHPLWYFIAAIAGLCGCAFYAVGSRRD